MNKYLIFLAILMTCSVGLCDPYGLYVPFVVDKAVYTSNLMVVAEYNDLKSVSIDGLSSKDSLSPDYNIYSAVSTVQSGNFKNASKYFEGVPDNNRHKYFNSAVDALKTFKNIAVDGVFEIDGRYRYLVHGIANGLVKESRLFGLKQSGDKFVLDLDVESGWANMLFYNVFSILQRREKFIAPPPSDIFIKMDHDILGDWYYIPILENTSQSKYKHPLNVYFKGDMVNVDVFKEVSAKQKNAVIAFYQKIYSLLEQGNLVAFSDNLGANDKLAFNQAISGLSDSDKGKLSESISRGRTIKFVLNAEPIFVVFYNENNGHSLLRHEYVLKDRSGAFKLVNLYARNVWDEFFDSGFFQEKISEIMQGNGSNAH